MKSISELNATVQSAGHRRCRIPRVRLQNTHDAVHIFGSLTVWRPRPVRRTERRRRRPRPETDRNQRASSSQVRNSGAVVLDRNVCAPVAASHVLGRRLRHPLSPPLHRKGRKKEAAYSHEAKKKGGSACRRTFSCAPPRIGCRGDCIIDLVDDEKNKSLCAPRQKKIDQ